MVGGVIISGIGLLTTAAAVSGEPKKDNKLSATDNKISESNEEN